MSTMWTFRSRLLAILAVLALLVPSALVLAEPGPSDSVGGPDVAGGPDDDDGETAGNETGDDGPGNNSSRADDHRQGPRDDNDTDNDTDDNATDGGPSASGGRGHDDDDDEAETANDDDDDDNEGRGSDRSAEVRKNFDGGFTTSDASVDGRFVDFTLTDDGITGYTVDGVLVFDAIGCDGPLGADELESHGSEIEVEGDGGEFKAVDNPTGHFKIECEDGNVTLDLASGITATAGNGSRVLLEGDGNFTAYVKGDDGVTVDGDSIESSRARFAVHAPGLHGDGGEEIDAAIASGDIAAEVNVGRGHGKPEASDIEHGDVDVEVEEHNGRIVITVDGEGPGKTILVNVERDAIGRAEDLVIFFDGERIVHADDMDDVLTTLDGEDPEFLLVVGSDATQVLVNVPHFSTHTVEVQSIGLALPATPPGSVVAFALAAVGAVLFVGATWGLHKRGSR